MAEGTFARGEQIDSIIQHVNEFAADHQTDALRTRLLQRTIDRDSSSLAGILLSLSEQRCRIVATLSSGFVSRGHITSCGTDVIVLVGDDGRRTLIRTDEIDYVAVDSQEISSTSGLRAFATGDREPSTSHTFESVLRDLYAYGAAGTLVTRNGLISETVKYLGTDVVVVGKPPTVRTASHFVQYVRLASVIAVITE
jgi:hypothetical protein